MGKLKDYFFNEFNGDIKLKYQLDNKYRIINSNNLLDSRNLEEYASMINDIISLKNQKTYLLIPDLLRGNNYEKLITDLIHMTINRLICSKPRTHELAIYYVLYKYYKSSKYKNGNH